jgi:hypothetical protein
VRVGGEEIFWGGVQVGEIAAATAGDEDFFAGALRAFEEGDAFAALPCFGGAEEAGGAGAEDDGVVVVFPSVFFAQKCEKVGVCTVAG